MSKRALTSFISGFILINLLAINPAYAYLDPGTGSMVIQMAIAGILSAIFTIKMYWFKIKAFFLRMAGKEVEIPENLLEAFEAKEEEKEQEEQDSKH